MTELKGYKPLDKAIMEGETTVKVIDGKFLVACAIAKKINSDPSELKRLIGLVMNDKKNGQQPYNPDTTYHVLDKKGKPHKIFLSLSLIASALHVAYILQDFNVDLDIQKDAEDNLTGIVNII